MYSHSIHKVELQSYAIFPIRATLFGIYFLRWLKLCNRARFVAGFHCEKNLRKQCWHVGNVLCFC